MKLALSPEELGSGPAATHYAISELQNWLAWRFLRGVSPSLLMPSSSKVNSLSRLYIQNPSVKCRLSRLRLSPVTLENSKSFGKMRLVTLVRLETGPAPLRGEKIPGGRASTPLRAVRTLFHRGLK